MTNSNNKNNIILVIWTVLFFILGIFFGSFLGFYSIDFSIIELPNIDISSLGYFVGIFGVLGALYSVYLQNKYEQIRKIEENLRTERRKIYLELLKPHILLFSKMNASFTDSDNKDEYMNGIQTEINQIMFSEDYTQNSFDLVFFGSDEAITANNNFMQYLYNTKENENDPHTVFKLLANVFLAVRKDVGVKNTKLSELDMFKWKIKDIDKLKEINK